MKGRVSLLFWILFPSVLFSSWMRVHFIDVGKGDATLLEFQTGAILIDTGAQDQKNVAYLLYYLERFFKSRPKLNKTFKSIIITHNHRDHAMGLGEIMERYQAEYLIHNGRKPDPERVPDLVRSLADKDLKSAAVRLKDVKKGGLTNQWIDPVNPQLYDPVITVLFGGSARNDGKWQSENNHSIVIKVKFGQASFLFTGDLELEGTETMLKLHDKHTFDCDVYKVSHHGNFNALTKTLLKAATPRIAVIHVGLWIYGTPVSRKKAKTTIFAYERPSLTALKRFEGLVSEWRETPIHGPIFERDGQSRGTNNLLIRDVIIRKKVYSTAWDGDVVLQASYNGEIKRVFLKKSRKIKKFYWDG